jgi:cell division protein FtsQ
MAADLIPDFTVGVQQRRQQLRQERNRRFILFLWRTLVVSSMAIGLGYAAFKMPFGLLIGPQQIQVKGNQQLSASGLKSLLKISYPKPLAILSPEAIAQQMMAQPAIAHVEVARQLFPPELTLRIQERHPVAIAHAATAPDARLSGIGLLDATGTWIPLDTYKSLAPTFEPPALRVEGMRSMYLHHWAKLYQTIQKSPVKITQIDWHNPANLRLNTELGMVYCGAFVPTKFEQQLLTLDQLRKLPSKLPQYKVRMDALDLTNPEDPILQVK